MWRIGLLLAVVMATLASPAAAAERTGEPATVISTTGPQGAALTLAAQDATTGGLCLDVTFSGLATPDAACLAPSATPSGDLAVRSLRRPGATVFYGATTSATRRVDLTLGSQTLRLATRAGRAYTGVSAGKVRFYAAAVKGTPAIGAVTVRAARGRVRVARDLNPLALRALGRRWTAERLRDEQDRASALVVLAADLLAPKPGNPGRRVRALCAGLRTGGVAGRAVCAKRSTRLETRFGISCDTGREVLYGVGPAFIHRATAVLSDGTRRPVEVRHVPRSVRRAGVVLLLQVPSGQAFSVLAYDKRGTRVGTAKLTGGAC
jgi:hypothetical protein